MWETRRGSRLRAGSPAARVSWGYERMTMAEAGGYSAGLMGR